MGITADQLDVIQRAFGCSAPVAEAVAARASDRRHAVQEAIVRQGDRARETFLLTTGLAHALRYGSQGQKAFLQAFEPGDLFGAVTQPDSDDHEADVVAITPSRTAVFRVADFVALVDAYSLGLALSRILMRQLLDAKTRMAAQIMLPATQRVCDELLRLARQADGCTIRPLPVLSDLAVRVNTARETVSRTISDLERRGLLRRDADALVLTAPQRLEDLF